MLSVKVNSGNSLSNLYACNIGNYESLTDPYFLSFYKLVADADVLSTISR